MWSPPLACLLLVLFQISKLFNEYHRRGWRLGVFSERQKRHGRSVTSRRGGAERGTRGAGESFWRQTGIGVCPRPAVRVPRLCPHPLLTTRNRCTVIYASVVWVNMLLACLPWHVRPPPPRVPISRCSLSALIARYLRMRRNSQLVIPTPQTKHLHDETQSMIKHIYVLSMYVWQSNNLYTEGTDKGFRI